MKRWSSTRCTMVFGCMLACVAGTADARLPTPSEAQKAGAAVAAARAQKASRKQAEALSRAQDRAVENYKHKKDGTSAATAAVKKTRRKGPVRRVERLACQRGTEDRQARIIVEVVNGSIQNFAYYSKWKPRTCSVAIERNDAYSKWQDNGRFTTVTTEKGTFLIENTRRNIHFIFRDVERERYCGADGRINGTLTVWRGKSQCELNGLMDNDPNEMQRDVQAGTVTEQSSRDMSVVQR